jgi:hypothetical protein
MNEVLSLAKTMEVKSVSGPAIGAKSGINFDPNDPRKKAFCNVGTKVSLLKKLLWNWW